MFDSIEQLCGATKEYPSKQYYLMQLVKNDLKSRGIAPAIKKEEPKITTGSKLKDISSKEEW